MSISIGFKDTKEKKGLLLCCGYVTVLELEH